MREELERENRGLRCNNDILRQASADFARASSTACGKNTPQVDILRDEYGIGPVCYESDAVNVTKPQRSGTLAQSMRRQLAV